MKLVVLPGKGIGPEIMASAFEVLRPCDTDFGLGAQSHANHPAAYQGIQTE